MRLSGSGAVNRRRYFWTTKAGGQGRGGTPPTGLSVWLSHVDSQAPRSSHGFWFFSIFAGCGVLSVLPSQDRAGGKPGALLAALAQAATPLGLGREVNWGNGHKEGGLKSQSLGNAQPEQSRHPGQKLPGENGSKADLFALRLCRERRVGNTGHRQSPPYGLQLSREQGNLDARLNGGKKAIQPQGQAASMVCGEPAPPAA